MLLARFTQKSVEIEWLCIHRDRTVGIVQPFFLRAIAIQLESVLVRVSEVKCFANSVIARAFERNLGRKQSPERVAKGRAIGIKNGNVKQTGAARRRWRTAEAFPRVQSDVMMIVAGRNKRRFFTQRCVNSNPSTPQ